MKTVSLGYLRHQGVLQWIYDSELRALLLGLERVGWEPPVCGVQPVDWQTILVCSVTPWHSYRRLDARAEPMFCWLTKSFLSETFLVFWLHHISNEIKLMIMKSTRNEFGISVISFVHLNTFVIMNSMVEFLIPFIKNISPNEIKIFGG